MRQQAWLHAVPRPRDSNRTKAREGSRLHGLKEKGREPRLPQASAFQYLEDYLFEVGPVEAAGMGVGPVSFQEMDAWATRVPRGYQPWEFLMLRRLSSAWASEMSRAEDPDAAAPYQGEITDEELRSVAQSLRAAIRGMAK